MIRNINYWGDNSMRKGLIFTLGCILSILIFTYNISRSAANEVTNKSMLILLHSVILKARFNCPRVALAYYKGMVPRGREFKIYCGPKDSDGVYSNLSFSVVGIGETVGGFLVRPWDESESSAVYVLIKK